MTKIKGIKETLNEFKQFGKEADVVIDQVTEASSKDIMLTARQLAPKDTGGLSGSIFQEEVSKNTYKIFSAKPYAAYMEFGTGAKVKVPSEMKDVANEFRTKSKGSFEEGVRAIADWLKRKGGDPKDAKWILFRILKRGLTPQPFLYPAFVKGRKTYLKDLKQELEVLTKKYKK